MDENKMNEKGTYGGNSSEKTNNQEGSSHSGYTGAQEYGQEQKSGSFSDNIQGAKDKMKEGFNDWKNDVKERTQHVKNDVKEGAQHLKDDLKGENYRKPERESNPDWSKQTDEKNTNIQKEMSTQDSQTGMSQRMDNNTEYNQSQQGNAGSYGNRGDSGQQPTQQEGFGQGAGASRH